jgi:hypothetical protein
MRLLLCSPCVVTRDCSPAEPSTPEVETDTTDELRTVEFDRSAFGRSIQKSIHGEIARSPYKNPVSLPHWQGLSGSSGVVLTRLSSRD